MPLDTTEFDKRIQESKFSTSGKTGTVVGQGEAVMQLALEVVKANFPDLVARTHAKISGEAPTYPGATGEYRYSLFSGEFDGIRLKDQGRIYPAVRKFTPSEEGKKQGLKPSEEVNFTTAEVLTGVETVLHEMYHGRSRAGFINEGAKFSNLTPKQKQLLNSLAESGKVVFGKPFSSMNPDYLNEEEFMANADALLGMQERGLVMPGSQTQAKLNTLEEIIKQVPEAAAFIAARREPNIPTLKAPPEGTLGALIQSVIAAISDTSVKETAGGAKPGTPRKKE